MDLNDGGSVEVMRGLRITPLDEDEDSQNVEDGYNHAEDDNEEEYDHAEDDDDEDDVPVTLGFVEKPEKPWSLSRQLFPSKAGGVPAWLDPVSLPSGKSTLCGVCGEPLQFLLQVYAPLSENESTFHRTFYVFTCTSMNCILRDQHEQWKRAPDMPSRSVKVFRCQLPRVNSFYLSDPPKYDGTDKPLGVGAPLCSWCGTWKGDKVCSRCKRARYCSEKHQALHWRSDHKTACQRIVVSSQPSDSQLLGDTSRETLKAAKRNLWPEYEIKNEDECESDVEVSGEMVDVSTKQSMDNFQNDEDKISWATFQERIGRAPEQVMRYCRSAEVKPLWPTSSGRPSKADIPRCNYCGSDRNFEFQILPQLLYYFGVNNDHDSLDWATIAVYTCSDSCEAASMAYKEEFAWIQLSSQAA